MILPWLGIFAFLSAFQILFCRQGQHGAVHTAFPMTVYAVWICSVFGAVSTIVTLFVLGFRARWFWRILLAPALLGRPCRRLAQPSAFFRSFSFPARDARFLSIPTTPRQPEDEPLGAEIQSSVDLLPKLTVSAYGMSSVCGMGMRRLLVFMLAFPILCSADQPATVKELSKNGGELHAYVLPVDQEDRIVVRRLDPRDIAELSLFSKDCQSGGHVENIEWAPKGEYLVFSTSSSGGHSPWNFRTYVFSSERWEFIGLDDVIAPVTSASFAFKDPTHLSIETLKSPQSSTDETEVRTIDLDALPWKQPKVYSASAE